MDPINVLVVDDSLVIRGMIVNILERDPGITVVGAAANAADADAVLRTRIVDVVTLDVEMPGMSGMDYLPSLARRHIPTVMLSGHTGEGSEESSEAMRQGATACFDKADAVRQSAVLIRQIKEAAHRRTTLWSKDKPVLADEGADRQPASSQPAVVAGPALVFAPTQEPSTGNSADPLALADELAKQHGPAALHVLAEHVGRLALRGEVKHIETWRAMASRLALLLAEPGHG